MFKNMISENVGMIVGYIVSQIIIPFLIVIAIMWLYEKIFKKSVENKKMKIILYAIILMFILLSARLF